MDIFSEIKSDHRDVERLFDDLMDTTEGEERTRRKLFSEIRDQLLAHNQAEEELFYSKLNGSRLGRVLSQEGKYEHQIGAQLIDELDRMDLGSEEWTAKAKVLRDLVDHHVKEEESEIHPEARKRLTEDEARRLGQAFVKMKEELKTLNHVA